MRTSLQRLSRCHGFAVLAKDGPVGTVETPLFPPDGHDPDYLVLHVSTPHGSLRPLVPCALVALVDGERRTVYLAASRDEVAALPGDLPLLHRTGRP
jgi:hypothetical protein